MISTEYIRNCNCNYVRLALEKKPQEKRYQYCILSRGGIKHLLPCSLRYIDNAAFLYYDISSKQNIINIFAEKKVDREWFADFLWSMKQMNNETERFLLGAENIIWSPEHIYQDLDKKDFFFLYVPYNTEETGLGKMCDFFVEHIDYEDEEFVEYIYGLYDKIRQSGILYLDKMIHEDFQKIGERKQEVREGKTEEKEILECTVKEQVTEIVPERKTIRLFKDGKKKKQVKKAEYREMIKNSLNGMSVYKVCEESQYENSIPEEILRAPEPEEYGKTIYIEESVEQRGCALFKLDGERLAELTKFPFVIGKKKENVDLVLKDYSASRVHARITKEDGICYVEDLNSTNGTYKNGLRLQPYEKRKLDLGDELMFGKTECVYR